jgi:glutamate-ammonia-ligase adenylyltransferase
MNMACVLFGLTPEEALLGVTANAALIEACRSADLLDAGQAAILTAAHADLLQRALTCTMDLRPRIAPRDAELEQLCARVRGVTDALGFEFG